MVARERLFVGRASFMLGMGLFGSLAVVVNNILPESEWNADFWEEMNSC